VKKHKILIAVAIFIASIVVVCLIVAVVFSSLAKRPKLAALDDSDLIPLRTEVPVESNAFWTLSRATNELYWPQSLERKLGNLSNNTNWDDSLAADVLEKNHSCLNLFDEAMRQPFFLVPEPKTLAEDYPYLGRWRTISRVESIRAVALFRAKNERDAFDSTLKIIKFGQRAENSGGGIIHYLVGSAIKAIGLHDIQQMTAQTTLQETNLVELIHELDNFKANKEGLTNALKVEYQTKCKLLDDLAAGKNPMTNSESNQITPSFGTKLFFNPTKTKMEFAQVDRIFRDSISKPFSEIPWSDLPVAETNFSVWKHLIKGNAIGDILFELTGPSLKGFATRKSRENVNVTATQLLLALKIYKTRHGKLPESLSELVPEFFPQVPIDDFDGKSFRYLPDKKIIYSVGPDLKDSGGESFHKNSESYDLPFKIEF
jgi:hypothetical protein